MLLANKGIGLREQSRLQPEIAEAQLRCWPSEWRRMSGGSLRGLRDETRPLLRPFLANLTESRVTRARRSLPVVGPCRLGNLHPTHGTHPDPGE
jgi:hypothetical protein